MLNRSASLAMSTSVLKALPGKLDIKRHSPSILYLSEHHRKCYRLMKYIINGEPFPLKSHKNRIAKYFETDHTVFHSYILKRAVWEHHYIEECNEEIHLGNCVRKMLSLVVSITRLFAYCKGGNFNIHIWALFGYFISSGREIRFYL